jgi:isocitrate/isopropylmalate dehydrogenase
LAHQITLIPGDGIGPEITGAIEGAPARVIERVDKITKDINPQKYVGISEFADAVIKEL